MLTSGSGPVASYTEVALVVLLSLVLACLVYLNCHVVQPYVWIIDYKYKPGYYNEFILPQDYDVETQGRKWANWHQDETGIQTICNLFNKSAGYINKYSKTSKNGRLGLKLWEEWIMAFLEELEKTEVVNPTFQGFPWGKNWYQFTISAPTNMAYYIVNKGNSRAVNRHASKAIQYLIKDPEHSLGYTRDKANSAMMLFPWTLSHMITGTLDKTHPSYKYAVTQYDLRPNKTLKANEDGIHLDYAYLTHNGVYAFGYLDSINAIYPDTSQIIADVRNLDLDYHIDQIHSKLWHPTIPLSGSTLFHRRRERKCGLYKGRTKTPKAMVVPTMRYLRLFSEDYQWSVRLGQRTIAYYECDQVVYDMGLYSCFCKQAFYHSDDPSKAPFPATGFVYPKGATALPEVDPNPDDLTHPTTHPYYSGQDSNGAHSYCFVDYDKMIAYFQVIGVIYTPLLQFHCGESGYIDINNDTMKYWFNTAERDHAGYVLHWAGVDYHLDEIDRPAGHEETTECDYNFRDNSGSAHGVTEPYTDHYTQNLHTADHDYSWFVKGALHMNENAHNYVPDKYVVIFKHDEPFIYSPAETDIISDTQTAEVFSKTYKFVWNPEWNQYLYEGYVVKNTNIVQNIPGHKEQLFDMIKKKPRIQP
nr:ODV-E66 [Menippe mercenaria nudivirus]